MGTDIHMIGETYDRYDSAYRTFTVPEIFTGRNYSFFAAIGNVRNGIGFAGIFRHDPVTPISDNRGIPEDASEYTKKLIGYFDDDPLGINWLGDHSFSFVTLEELKSYNWPTVIKTGVMSYADWVKWDKVNPPESYFGAVDGNSVITVSEKEISSTKFEEDKEYYVQFTFQAPLVDPGFVEKLINYMELQKEYGNEDDSKIRLVFGFDS